MGATLREVRFILLHIESMLHGFAICCFLSESYIYRYSVYLQSNQHFVFSFGFVKYRYTEKPHRKLHGHHWPIPPVKESLTRAVGSEYYNLSAHLAPRLDRRSSVVGRGGLNKGWMSLGRMFSDFWLGFVWDNSFCQKRWAPKENTKKRTKAFQFYIWIYIYIFEIWYW